MEARPAELTTTAAELLPAPTRGTGLPTGTSAGAAKFTTVLAQPPSLSTETPRRLEDTLNPAVRAASTLAPLAATTMAERPGAIHHAEAPASVAAHRVAAAALAAAEDFTAAVAAEDFTVAVAGIGNRVSLCS